MPDSSAAAEPPLLVLDTAEVADALARVDPVAVVRDALAAHARGETTLPDEAYLPWHTATGAFARSLALPGAVWGDRPAVGLKVINSSLENPDRGLPRAQGLTFLFDPATARPVAMMPAAAVSATRTAACTVLSVRLLAAPQVTRVAVLGCGALAATHLEMLAAELPGASFVLHDLVPERAADLAGDRHATAASAGEAVAGAGLVVCTTTTTTGYLALDQLAPGALVAHVSLDDVLPDVVLGADLVVVDDWDLVAADDRRVLGRMWRDGRVTGPGGERHLPGEGRRVDATLADLVAGTHPGRARDTDVVLSNPFGMGILDVALAAVVRDVAVAAGRGTTLRL